MSDTGASDNASDEIDRLNERVLALAESFTKDNKPLLLSQLGKLLGDDLQKIKSITGQSLSSIFKEQLSDKFDLVQIGSHQNIAAIVPKANLSSEETLATRLADLFDTDEGSVSAERYNRRFWAAFAVPAQSAKRFIDIFTFLFRDVEVEDVPTATELEIPVSDVPEANVDRRDAKVHHAINKWLVSNNLDRNRFLVRDNNSSSPVAMPAKHQKNALDVFLSALDQHQLRTASLPLDVISALYRKKV